MLNVSRSAVEPISIQQALPDLGLEPGQHCTSTSFRTSAPPPGHQRRCHGGHEHHRRAGWPSRCSSSPPLPGQSSTSSARRIRPSREFSACALLAQRTSSATPSRPAATTRLPTRESVSTPSASSSCRPTTIRPLDHGLERQRDGQQQRATHQPPRLLGRFRPLAGFGLRPRFQPRRRQGARARYSTAGCCRRGRRGAHARLGRAAGLTVGVDGRGHQGAAGGPELARCVLSPRCRYREC